MANINILAYFFRNSIPATALVPLPIVNIRRIDTGVLVVAGENMVEVGDGCYKYDFTDAHVPPFNPSINYAVLCDGIDDTLDERYNYGGGTTLVAGVDEILDLLENKLVVNNATSELWLYDDAGLNVVKKWPLRDKSHLANTVTLANLATTTPVDREKRTL